MSVKKLNDVFLTPTGLPYFWDKRPQEGFYLIPAGEKVLIERMFSDKANDIRWREGFYLTVPIGAQNNTQANMRPLLLMPNSYKTEEISFNIKESEPLFQTFANLKTDEDILAFANKYGNLTERDLYHDSDQDKQIVWLEGLDLWKRESAHMRKIIEAVGYFEYEFRKPIHPLVILSGYSGDFEKKDDGNYRSSTYRFCLDVSEELQEGITDQQECVYWRINERSKKDRENNLYRGIVEMCNKKIHHYGCEPIYRVYKDQARPYLAPKNLAAAIWLDFAQTFCKDKPEDKETLPRLCFKCGKYDDPNEGNMHQIKKSSSPYRELWYHERCYRNQIMRKRRAEEAKRRGIQPKKHADRIQYID